MHKRILMAMLAVAAFAGSARGTAAQDIDTPLRVLRAGAGGAFLIAVPMGEFDDYVNTGWGIGGHFFLRLDRQGIIGLRLDGAYINYGRETRRVCFGGGVGCLIQLDLTTSNDIFSFGFGPQIAVPYGPVQPYVYGGIGGSYFATVSSVEGSSNDNEPFARTTNFDDFTFAWNTGGGLRIPVSRGATPIAIDLGARYIGNGEVEYLREGSIETDPDGSIRLNPIRSDANLLTIHLGVTIGVRW